MKPNLISRVLFSLSILSLLTLEIKSAPTFVYVRCQNETSNYNLNGTYHTNLKTLFSILSSNATRISGFYNSTAGRNHPDIAYGLFLCRGDLSPADCQGCVTTAGKEVVERCPRLKTTIYYDQCMLRHSNEPFFSLPDKRSALILRNTQNVEEPNIRLLIDTLNGIARRAPNGNGSGKKFAVAEANYSSVGTLYSLAQCTPDISPSDCSSCLVEAVSDLTSRYSGFRGGQYLLPTCTLRFDLQPFYNVAAAPPPSPTSNPPSRRSQIFFKNFIKRV